MRGFDDHLDNYGNPGMDASFADDWRDDAADIGDDDYVEVTWKVWSGTGTGRKMFDTDFVLTAEQARAVLNTLAELEDNR